MIKKKQRIEKDGKFYSVRGIELTRCSNTLTECAFFAWIRSKARGASLRWKPRTDFLLSIRRPYEGSNKKIKWEYCCQECKEWFILKGIQVDHIVPCGSIKCFDDIGKFYERLLVEKDGFQALCKPCHQRKTNKNTDK